MKTLVTFLNFVKTDPQLLKTNIENLVEEFGRSSGWSLSLPKNPWEILDELSPEEVANHLLPLLRVLGIRTRDEMHSASEVLSLLARYLQRKNLRSSFLCQLNGRKPKRSFATQEALIRHVESVGIKDPKQYERLQRGFYKACLIRGFAWGAVHEALIKRKAELISLGEYQTSRKRPSVRKVSGESVLKRRTHRSGALREFVTSSHIRATGKIPPNTYYRLNSLPDVAPPNPSITLARCTKAIALIETGDYVTAAKGLRNLGVPLTDAEFWRFIAGEFHADSAEKARKYTPVLYNLLMRLPVHTPDGLRIAAGVIWAS